MGNLDVKYLFESQCELIDNIKELLKVLDGKKYGKELEIYLDMDRTIIELIFDIEESFTQKGNYIKKVPIKPVINQLEKYIDYILI